MAQRRQEKVPADDIWYVYLLRCAGGSLYTGITKDLKRRCRQHDEGTASRYTRSRRPVALVYHEAHASRGLALKAGGGDQGDDKAREVGDDSIEDQGRMIP